MLYLLTVAEAEPTSVRLNGAKGAAYKFGMLVQIYEVSTPGEARAIAELGVDHIGLLVGDGRFPRELPIDIARDVIAAVAPPATQSVLLLAADLPFIEAAVAALEPPIVHLGASPELLGPADVAWLKARFPMVRFMRSVPVVGDQSVDLACAYDGIADLLLLDSHEPGDQQVGALGRTHDWTISRRIVATVRTPVILAGGLGPSNVAAAMAAVCPAGVDSKTRTDRNDGSHRKDLDLVREFVRLAKSAGI
jgi:phosphoribosylanthranilate isomerase